MMMGIALVRASLPREMACLLYTSMMITQVYGMTETCGDGIINYEQDEKHIRAVGKPCLLYTSRLRR